MVLHKVTLAFLWLLLIGLLLVLLWVIFIVVDSFSGFVFIMLYLLWRKSGMLLFCQDFRLISNITRTIWRLHKAWMLTLRLNNHISHIWRTLKLESRAWRRPIILIRNMIIISILINILISIVLILAPAFSNLILLVLKIIDRCHKLLLRRRRPHGPADALDLPHHLNITLKWFLILLCILLTLKSWWLMWVSGFFLLIINPRFNCPHSVSSARLVRSLLYVDDLSFASVDFIVVRHVYIIEVMHALGVVESVVGVAYCWI